MVFLGGFKFYYTAFLLVYLTYLTTYKCPKLGESNIEHNVKAALHPLSHHHSLVCDILNKGKAIISPYTSTATSYVHENVNNHPKLKEFEVESKVNVAQQFYFDHVYPLVIKLFEYIEVFEIYAYDHAVQQWQNLKALYVAKISPLLS